MCGFDGRYPMLRMILGAVAMMMFAELPAFAHPFDSVVATNDVLIGIDPALRNTTVTPLGQIKNPRGFDRRGLFGYGGFCEYSFGNTCYTGTNEVLRTEGTMELREIQSPLTDSRRHRYPWLRVFDSVSLFLGKSSRRLVRVEFHSRDIPLSEMEMRIGEIRKMIDYDLALALVPTESRNVKHGLGKPLPISLYEAEDSEFQSRLAVLPSSKSMGRISVSVTSKKALRGSEPPKSIPTESELKVNVDEL